MVLTGSLESSARGNAELLADCANEPIRYPGSIQPRGHLLVFQKSGTGLVACSANCDAATLAALAEGFDRRRFGSLAPGAAPIGLGTTRAVGQLFEVFVHRTDAHCIAEFERAEPPLGNEAPIYSLTRLFLTRLQQAQSLDELTQLAADEVKRLTGFGRSLVYRFNEAGDGEVLAEAREQDYDSYAGHHFPAADIPRQARDLYLRNHFRLIADANYVPVPLRAPNGGAVVEAIDLAQAQLRSVSPIHLEYMRNMGTLASMSVSIVIKGRLWGLVSCHDHAAKEFSVPVQRACEHLGQLLAMRIESLEATKLIADSLELRNVTLSIVSRLGESDASLHQLVDEPAYLLRLTRAHGAAVVLDDSVWTVGDVPAHADIAELASWISGLGANVYESSELARHFPPAAAFSHAAGVLAVSISQVHRHLIIWFRPELIKEIAWAGNPNKPMVSVDGRIHPRASFASWVEQIRGQSMPWSPTEVGAVGELRQALVGIVLRRAEEIAVIATELGRVNKELEAFSYTVSHDLRAPLRHIAGYIDLVLEVDGKQLPERLRRYLANAKEASAFAGQLIDALLNFSRVSRSALKHRPVDCLLLVQDVVRELSRDTTGVAMEWHIDKNLPTLLADPLLLQVVVRNLLSNAMKYSRDRQPGRITVRAVSTPQGDGLEVEDNGVGFQMQYVDKLFGVFQRLHQAEDFEGTGIGLATVKRIVERHGGSVWARGEVNRGACFGFTLPAGDTLPSQPTENREENAQADPFG